MKELIVVALPGNETFAGLLAEKLRAPIGKTEIRRFPDGESYVRILEDVVGKEVVMVCTLDRPDEKLLPLYFLSKTAKSLGAHCTCLVAPYLAYMRQDMRFKSGEGITSEYFAQLISGFADRLITVDPHLHRRSSLDEIYAIPTKVAHAAPEVSAWIKRNVNQPVLIGPDSESEQWVAEVAKMIEVPFRILEKVRSGDKQVRVSVPDIGHLKTHTPILLDDIISTARTMIETVRHIQVLDLRPPICIGVHGIFADDADRALREAGVNRVVTCNSVNHESNEIDLSRIVSQALMGEN